MDETGSLVVHVYTSRTQIPIGGATVIFMLEGEDGRYETIGERTTDQNGKTEPILIDTPAVMASMSPGILHSHSIVRILVDHPNYQMIEVDNIEIFPGVQSFQRVPMLPLTRSQMELMELQKKSENSVETEHPEIDQLSSALPNPLLE